MQDRCDAMCQQAAEAVPRDQEDAAALRARKITVSLALSATEADFETITNDGTADTLHGAVRDALACVRQAVGACLTVLSDTAELRERKDTTTPSVTIAATVDEEDDGETYVMEDAMVPKVCP